MRPSRPACAVLLGSLLLAACGTSGPATTAGTTSGPPSPAASGSLSPAPDSAQPSTGQPNTGPPNTGQPTPVQPSTAPPGTLRPEPSASQPKAGPTNTKPITVRRDGEPALVTAVRYAAHPGFDRVVIDFKDDIPGYRIEWVEALVQDGSGDEIDVDGGAYLHILLQPANAHDDKGRQTWKGGPIYPARLANITHVVRTGDFEAHVGVGLVLARRAGFEVKEQPKPNRLVIDVAS